MYVFTDLASRDSFTTANQGDKCRVGDKRYTFSRGRWRELVDVLTLEGTSDGDVVGCGCNCGCGE